MTEKWKIQTEKWKIQHEF